MSIGGSSGHMGQGERLRLRMRPACQHGKGFEELGAENNVSRRARQEPLLSRNTAASVTVEATTGKGVSSRQYWVFEGVFMGGFSKKKSR